MSQKRSHFEAYWAPSDPTGPRIKESSAVAFSNPENDGNEPRSYRDHLAGQKADTRRRILRSAREIFLRSGFVDANLNEVAAGAGVGKGTLYRHFENKGELYVAMLSEHGQLLAEEMAAVLEAGAPTLKQLEKVAAFYMEFWQRHPEHFQIIWAVQNRELIGPLSDELLANLRRVFEAPLRVLESLIRRGVAEGELRAVDPWNAANAMALSVNAIVGPVVHPVTPIVDRDLREVYRQLIDLFLAGLRTNEAEAR